LTYFNRHPIRCLGAAFFAGLLLLLWVDSSAIAQTAAPVAQQPLVVAVLDVQQVMVNAKAAKSVRAALEKQAAAFQAELAQQENAIRSADQQLQQQRASLSPQDYEAKRAELGKKVEALRQKAASRNKQLQQMENGALSQVEQALAQTAGDIAKARGLTLVLNKAMVVLNVTSYDITKEALAKLDARLPSVQLPPAQ
jgi:Skp family chaperone for outer membrane proteins